MEPKGKSICLKSCTVQSLSRYEILNSFASLQFIRSCARSSGPMAPISLLSFCAHLSELPPNPSLNRTPGGGLAPARRSPVSYFVLPRTIAVAHQSLKSQSLGLVGWLIATFAAGSVGAMASARAASFYGQLSQPAWAPPAWLFGPGWSALYVFMAVAAWLVWRK